MRRTGRRSAPNSCAGQHPAHPTIVSQNVSRKMFLKMFLKMFFKMFLKKFLKVFLTSPTQPPASALTEDASKT